MNNDNWLNNLASSLGVDTGTSHDHSAVSTSVANLHQSSSFTLDLNTSLEQSIHQAQEVTLHLPNTLSEKSSIEPHAWHQHPTWLHSDDTKTSTEISGLAQIAQAISLDNTNILSSHQRYDANNSQGLVMGNPQESIKHFHQQNYPDTCAIAVQQSVIESTTGVNLSENQLIQTAQNYNLYNQGSGTPINNLGDLVSLQTNVSIEKHFGSNLSEIADKIANGEQVMVSVNSQIVNVPDSNSIFGDFSSEMLKNAVANNDVANHVVQVVGIEIKNGDIQHPYVIVNDPSSPDGKGIEIPAEQFNAAWETGGNFMASTVTNPESLLSSLGANRLDSQHPTDYNVGCEVTFISHYNYYEVWIDNRYVYDNRGHTYYFLDGSIAGTWACASDHHAYTTKGKDLGYAPTEKDAVSLIYGYYNS